MSQLHFSTSTLECQQSSKRTGFLDLPYELRSTIYQYLTTEASIQSMAVTSFAAMGSAPQHVSRPPRLPRSALAICRQIRVEILRSIVSTRLHVDLRRCYPVMTVDTYQDLLKTMDQTVVASLQTVTIHVDLDTMDLALGKQALRRTIIALWDVTEAMIPGIQKFYLKIRGDKSILLRSHGLILAFPAQVRIDLEAFFKSRCGDLEERVIPSWAHVLLDFEVPHLPLHEELNSDYVIPAWETFKREHQEKEAARQLKKRNDELAKHEES